MMVMSVFIDLTPITVRQLLCVRLLSSGSGIHPIEGGEYV